MHPAFKTVLKTQTRSCLDSIQSALVEQLSMKYLLDRLLYSVTRRIKGKATAGWFGSRLCGNAPKR